MKGNQCIFYTPEIQYPLMPHGEMCGDIMPFYWEGRFILFFLYKYCIYAVETKDFVHYEKCRLVLRNGTPDEQDWHAATGSVIHVNGLFYFYYTGFCEGNRGIEGKHEQAILRAVSKDLNTWEKDRDYFFEPDVTHFGERHWRDPHVFWNEEIMKYCMLITAVTKDGAVLRNGCTAVYISEDVTEWYFYKIIYAPDLFPTHECQDIFRSGEKWYLTFSTYRRQWETRYRYSDSFDGPWQTPSGDDMFDGRQFYAAKTVTDGRDRYLVGWQSIRKDCRDENPLVWGGNIIVHKIIQRQDKTLGVEIPEAVRCFFTQEVPLVPEAIKGNWKIAENITGYRNDGFGWLYLGELTELMMVEGVVKWQDNTQAVGLMIHTDGEKLEKWCQLRIEPGRNVIMLDRYNRIDGDQTFEEVRPMCYQRNEAHIRMIVSGNIILVYVNDVALSGRCYGITMGGVGLFVESGLAVWEQVKLKLPACRNDVPEG